MQRLTLVVLCFAVSVWAGAEEPKSHEVKGNKGPKGGASSQFNDADLDTVLDNPRILVNYVRCFIGEGPCTKVGRDIKQILPEAIRTECGNCDEKQKVSIAKVLKTLDQQRPDLFKKLMDKYDPEHKHQKSIRERITSLDNQQKKPSKSTS